MISSSTPPEPGGFLHPTLPSPPQSTITSPSSVSSTLPQPRLHPLKPGGSKESNFIDYVDRKLLDISRRYEKRFNADMQDQSASEAEGRGYESFGEVAKDMGSVLDVVWVSGTPSLQTAYLLTIALTVCTYITSFTFAPRQTFYILQKLDLAFSSLLQGRNVETGDTLPGFEGGRAKVSTTEKVRIKGLVERTRVAVVEISGKGGNGDDESGMGATETDSEDGFATDADTLMEDAEDDVGRGRWEMEIARVYERTIVELGSSLDFSGHDGLE
ncbi:hypothetical protein MMC24_004971 [Lignoscripta atroalba]|nr:hypothetical protein [Lignoscripta atroalba]